MNSTNIPTPTNDLLLDSPYGYRPTFWICVLYVALFSAALGMHLQQMFFSRYWFLGPTIVLCAALEVLGWVGRLWSNQNIVDEDPFMMQRVYLICCLIIGPTPLLAANFVIFGRLVELLGHGFSRLRPKLYTWIFLSCDIVSLIIQGAAGGLASTADPGTTAADIGKDLMIAGIALQVAMMTVFVILVSEYILRYVNDRPLKRERKRLAGSPSQRFPLDTRRQILLGAMGITTLLLFIRAVYRLIELSGGWNSKIAHTEWLFNVFDAACIFLALLTWNVAHPSLLLETSRSADEEALRMKQRTLLDRIQSDDTNVEAVPNAEIRNHYSE
ncbi:RTA1-domain-containing protein [Marasmius fiardii PR-910]|nr:RTA1-domain-containing protein [Marasmius fiardii PR-910]